MKEWLLKLLSFCLLKMISYLKFFFLLLEVLKFTIRDWSIIKLSDWFVFVCHLRVVDVVTLLPVVLEVFFEPLVFLLRFLLGLEYVTLQIQGNGLVCLSVPGLVRLLFESERGFFGSQHQPLHPLQWSEFTVVDRILDSSRNLDERACLLPIFDAEVGLSLVDQLSIAWVCACV